MDMLPPKTGEALARNKKKGGCRNLREDVHNPEMMQNWPTTTRDYKGCGNAVNRKDGKSRMDTLEAIAKFGQQDRENHSTNGSHRELQEEWRQIPGWGEKYQVSNLGRVRSRAHGAWKLMNLPIKSTGYPNASFRHNGKQKKVTVHILVALLFLGPRPDGMVINHKDGNKLNNTPENLEYVTIAENNTHARITGLARLDGENNPMAKLTGSQVADVLERLPYQSQREIAEMYGVHAGTIQAIASGRNWKHLKPESWRTPSTCETTGGQMSEAEARENNRTVKLRYQVEQAKIGKQTTARLNARWVETLMGLPVGWTMPSCAEPVTIAPMNCASWETESCRLQRNERGVFFMGG
jgi:transposase